MIEELTRNWIKKAENDLKIGNDELETNEPVTDMICFHAQQCVEKCLKAYLTFDNKYFRKTHDIAELIELCKEIDIEFDILYKSNADRLNIYAAEIRYPDDFYMPTIKEAKECLKIAKNVKDFIINRIKNKGLKL